MRPRPRFSRLKTGRRSRPQSLAFEIELERQAIVPRVEAAEVNRWDEDISVFVDVKRAARLRCLLELHPIDHLNQIFVTVRRKQLPLARVDAVDQTDLHAALAPKDDGVLRILVDVRGNQSGIV